VWTGSKVDLSHLRVFGCKAYALTPENQCKKIDAKSKPYIMLGYCKYSKGYRLADPLQPGKVIKARSVEFLESVAGESAQKFNVECSVSFSVIVPLSLELPAVQHEVVSNDLQDANECVRLSPSGEDSDVNSTSDDSNADDEDVELVQVESDDSDINAAVEIPPESLNESDGASHVIEREGERPVKSTSPI
jgi:hypothetical protein